MENNSKRAHQQEETKGQLSGITIQICSHIQSPRSKTQLKDYLCNPDTQSKEVHRKYSRRTARQIREEITVKSMYQDQYDYYFYMIQKQMETSRNTELLINLYHKRLQNLTSVINDLHHIIKHDQILSNLKDPSMEKYRIDRVNEIINEVFNSQKQKMLIRVLEKYNEVSAKAQQKKSIGEQNKYGFKNDNQQINNWRSISDKKTIQIQSLSNQIQQRNQTIKMKNKQIQALKQKISLLKSQNYESSQQSKKKQSCQNCQALERRLNQSETQKKSYFQAVEKLKRDGQQAVRTLNQKIKELINKNENLEGQLIEKSLILKQKKEQSILKNEITKRNEKIQVMRRQIGFLQEQLIQVQKQFNTIKDLALGSLQNQLKKVKAFQKKMKEYIIECLHRFSQENDSMKEQIFNKMLKSSPKHIQTLKPERLMTKLNQLENQLDYFLQNQVLVE